MISKSFNSNQSIPFTDIKWVLLNKMSQNDIYMKTQRNDKLKKYLIKLLLKPKKNVLIFIVPMTTLV